MITDFVEYGCDRLGVTAPYNATNTSTLKINDVVILPHRVHMSLERSSQLSVNELIEYAEVFIKNNVYPLEDKIFTCGTTMSDANKYGQPVKVFMTQNQDGAYVYNFTTNYFSQHDIIEIMNKHKGF